MKAPNSPSVVFLFGAGASADLGIPTMAGFRERLSAVAESRRGRASRLAHLLDDIGVDKAEGNLEAIWSRLDMACAVGVPKAEWRRREFVELVGEAYVPARPRDKACAYLQLLRCLHRELERGPAWLSTDRVSFLTFNHDAALDCALYKARSLPDLCYHPYEKLR